VCLRRPPPPAELPAAAAAGLPPAGLPAVAAARLKAAAGLPKAGAAAGEAQRGGRALPALLTVSQRVRGTGDVGDSVRHRCMLPAVASAGDAASMPPVCTTRKLLREWKVS